MAMVGRIACEAVNPVYDDCAQQIGAARDILEHGLQFGSVGGLGALSAFSEDLHDVITCTSSIFPACPFLGLQAVVVDLVF
jgi:hypothetical protein